ncbi:MAG: hypothetical protein Q4A15_01680, partial [Prevotellaceae bacterium]|nr:hypothetical protein [Prevotellaceae bacterium]
MEISPEDYYDILMENLADIGEMPLNATPEQIAMFVDSIKPHVDLIPHALGNLHLFRARYVDLNNPFDTSDPGQYGYIHNGYIKMFRYNRENEPVLYTATDPAIAFREIESPKQGNRYYLSVWRKKSKDKLNGAFIISSRYKKGSNAE